MNKISGFLGLLFLGIFLWTGNVMPEPKTDMDNYHSTDDYGYNDIIGNPDKLNVETLGKGATKKTTSPVPEPATMFLFGTGLIGMAIVARNKFRK